MIHACWFRKLLTNILEFLIWCNNVHICSGFSKPLFKAHILWELVVIRRICAVFRWLIWSSWKPIPKMFRKIPSPHWCLRIFPLYYQWITCFDIVYGVKIYNRPVSRIQGNVVSCTQGIVLLYCWKGIHYACSFSLGVASITCLLEDVVLFPNKETLISIFECMEVNLHWI